MADAFDDLAQAIQLVRRSAEAGYNTAPTITLMFDTDHERYAYIRELMKSKSYRESRLYSTGTDFLGYEFVFAGIKVYLRSKEYRYDD